jgi:hypothetical protein
MKHHNILWLRDLCEYPRIHEIYVVNAIMFGISIFHA